MSKLYELPNMERTTLKLSEPLMVNGNPITEIPYDFESITAKDHILVERELKSKGVLIMAAQFDAEYLVNIFARAVSKITASVTLSDILRLSLKDCVRVQDLVRNFFFQESDAESSIQSQFSDLASPSQE